MNEENTSWMDRTVYYDGLGRPYQTLEQTCRDGSLTGKNLINLLEYDANGRQTNQWLPIQAGATDYLPLADFKTTAIGQYGNDTCPYTQSVYEASALNRVIEEYGPGTAWREGDHAVHTDYLTNGTDFPLSCKDYSVSGEGALVTGGIRAGHGRHPCRRDIESDPRHGRGRARTLHLHGQTGEGTFGENGGRERIL